MEYFLYISVCLLYVVHSSQILDTAKKINELLYQKRDIFGHKEGPDFSLYPDAVTNTEVLYNEDPVGISNGNTMSAPSSVEPTNVQVAVCTLWARYRRAFL